MLHLKTISAQYANPRTHLQEITCFLDYICKCKILELFYTGEQICMDVSIIKFKGRVSFITYNPKEPIKWSIKVYTIADSNTGYVCGILPYHGAFTTKN